MGLRRTSHAVYDTKYHLVWAPKYRKKILRGELRQRVKKMFTEIAAEYEIEIDRMELSEDHVHILCSFPPRYSIAQVISRFKSLSARAIFDEFPKSNGSCGEGSFGKTDTLLARWAMKSVLRSFANTSNIIKNSRPVN
jgi:REP-associated tyrosine transposase